MMAERAIQLHELLSHPDHSYRGMVYGCIFEDKYTHIETPIDMPDTQHITAITKVYNKVKHFKYGWATKTVQEFIADKCGSCIDVCNYLYHALPDMNPKCYYIEYLNEDKTMGGGHAFTGCMGTIVIDVFVDKLQGIHQFKSLADIIQTYKKIIQPQYPRSFKPTVYDYVPQDTVMTFSKWSTWIWKHSTIIT
jgi:hypothetical protein